MDMSFGNKIFATRPTQHSLASAVHTFEAVGWGSVSAPSVCRVMGGDPERNKNSKKISVKLHSGKGFCKCCLTFSH